MSKRPLALSRILALTVKIIAQGPWLSQMRLSGIRLAELEFLDVKMCLLVKCKV